MVPAGDIQLGDHVQTADNGLQPVIWCGHRHLNAAELAAHPQLRPIVLQPGSLLGNKRAVRVSPQHRFLLPKALTDGEERFLRAKLLSDLPFAGVRRARGVRAVTYVHLMTPRHEVIFAEGLPTETFWPGSQALQSLGPQERAEILHLFPALRHSAEGYGGLARKDLRRFDLRQMRLCR